MAFVNEYISQEDIKKYGLDEVWEKYTKDRTIKMLGDAARQWTINKNENIFMVPLAKVIAEEYDHGCSYTKEQCFLFYFQDKFFEIRLIMVDYKKAFSENGLKVTAYSVVWDLLSINPEAKDVHAFNENLKAALKTFGMNGVVSEDIKPQTIVVCNF